MWRKWVIWDPREARHVQLLGGACEGGWCGRLGRFLTLCGKCFCEISVKTSGDMPGVVVGHQSGERLEFRQDKQEHSASLSKQSKVAGDSLCCENCG